MIHLIRHGQAAGNQRGLYLGQSDPPLSPGGRAQAAALAARFPGTEAVWSSDLRRAVQTARAIAPEVRTDPRLREADFGVWTGLTWRQIARRWPDAWRAWCEDPESVAPPGGETLAQVRRRALAALAAIPSGSLVVTHGGVIRALVPEAAPGTGEVFPLRVLPVRTLSPRPGAGTAAGSGPSAGG